MSLKGWKLQPVDGIFLWGDLGGKAKKQVIHILQQSRSPRELCIPISAFSFQIKTLSKTLRHYRPVNCFPSQATAKVYCLVSSAGMLTNVWPNSLTVKNLLSFEVDVCWVWGLGTTRYQGIAELYAWRSWTDQPSPLTCGFSPNKTGVWEGISARDSESESCDILLEALYLEGCLYLYDIDWVWVRVLRDPFEYDRLCTVDSANIGWRFCP